MITTIFGAIGSLSRIVERTLLGIGRLVEQKIVGALLIAVLAGTALVQLSNHLFEVEAHEETAFHIEGVGEQVASAPAVEEETGLEPVSALLASADAGAGQTIFKRCAACHTVEAGGANKIGPNLWNRVGGAQAGHEGFAYSEAFVGLGGEWTYEELNAFLANPKAYAPGTKMNFTGLNKIGDRANLIAFLREQADNPLAMP